MMRTTVSTQPQIIIIACCITLRRSAYDMAGVRTSKTVNGTTYNYTTLSGKVMRQQWDGKTLEFVYDDGSQPFAMIYKHGSETELYYYLVNAQGDVAAILDSSGTMVASYNYDAWGNCTVYNSSDAAIGDLNPLRYRGYYYDAETGFYYLQSRYYDPAICRFINADTFATTDANGFLSANMFAYCENNPVNGCDPSGEWVHLIVGAVLGAVSNVALSYLNAKRSGDTYNLLTAGVDAASGAISGALAASGVGLAGQVIGNAAIDVAKGVLNGETSAKQIATNAFLGGVGGFIGGKGASYGNAKSIMRSGQQFAKRVFTYKDSFRKAYSYYRKTARAKGGAFVLHGLSKSVRNASIYSFFRGIFK